MASIVSWILVILMNRGLSDGSLIKPSKKASNVLPAVYLGPLLRLEINCETGLISLKAANEIR